MFTRITRSGGRAYLQLVESFRNEAGQPRQRVIANLGRLDQLTDKDLDPLINGLLMRKVRAETQAKADAAAAEVEAITRNAGMSEELVSSIRARILGVGDQA